MRYRRNPDAEKAAKVAYIERAVALLSNLSPIALYQLGDEYLNFIAQHLYKAASIANLQIGPYTNDAQEFMLGIAKRKSWFSALDEDTVVGRRPSNHKTLLKKNPSRKKKKSL